MVLHDFRRGGPPISDLPYCHSPNIGFVSNSICLDPILASFAPFVATPFAPNSSLFLVRPGAPNVASLLLSSVYLNLLGSVFFFDSSRDFARAGEHGPSLNYLAAKSRPVWISHSSLSLLGFDLGNSILGQGRY